MKTGESRNLCRTCAVEYAPPLPAVCPICADERQWVPSAGQAWTTLEELAAQGQQLRWEEREENRFAVTADPGLGIGQSMQVITSDAGVLLWDPVGYIDDATVRRVRVLGPVLGIASSHPHMFGVQVEWAHALDAPVLVNDADKQWLGRADPSISYWTGHTQVGPIALHQVGGHFAGSAVALWPAGSDGRGTLLTGDTVAPNPDRSSVGFMRSYPNKIPLSAAVVERIARDLGQLDFDTVVGNFNNEIRGNAADAIQRSARRHAEWVRGDHDALT
ncbi:MAG: hydrolase [Propionibacteriaceae bacterium]